MAERDNSGALFVNDRKQSDNHPDRKGDCTINGVEMWISGWLKKDKNGNTYLSLSFTPKDASQGKKPAAAKQEKPKESEINF